MQTWEATTNGERAMNLLAAGMMRAASHLLRAPTPELRDKIKPLLALSKDRQVELITTALKYEATLSMDETLREWKEALDANTGEAVLRELLNVQAWTFAVRGIKRAADAA